MIVPLLASIVLSLVGAPQEGADTKRVDDARRAKAERIERWKSLDAETRKELAKRYERLKSLSPEERAKLVERGERMQREIEATLRSLSPEERATIEALPRQERERVLRGLVGDRARMAAARLRGRLTKEQRAKLESATPAEREAILREVRRKERERMPERLVQLGRELGLSDGELRRVQRGTPEERRKVMFDVSRRRAQQYVNEFGLPDGVSPRRWRAVQSGTDEEFARGLLRIRARHPEFGVPPKRWEQRKQRRETMASRLESFSQPTMKERASARGAKDVQLRRRVLIQRRSRVEETLVRLGGLSLDEAARLRSLDDDGFVRAYMGAVRSLRRGGDVRTGIASGLEMRERAGRRRGNGRRRP